MDRRDALLIIGSVVLGGCAGNTLRSQSPEDADAIGDDVRLVYDMAVSFGMNPLKVEAVGLITGLDGTGADPDPSPQRAMLVNEMQTLGVRNPDNLLADPHNAMIVARGYLRPGIQKGDKFDIEVYVPSHAGSASLRNGWLMQTRLHENEFIGGQVHEGQFLGSAIGPVMVDPAATLSSDKSALSRGRILGGGTCLKTRTLGLVLKPDFQKVQYAGQVQASINRRFHTFAKGIKAGVASAKNDQYIELDVHPRYKDNVPRFMQVVRSLSVRESAAEQASRISLLERQLLDPLVSAAAALKLEALGRGGTATLKKGIEAKDPEVRFYAAEALAYLDESCAAEPLARAAKDEPAFRVFAFTALSAMDDVAAYDRLVELLHVPSAETRYGAFRALWAMNAQDRVVRGEDLGGQFSYHVIDSSGPPMVHVTRSYRAEIVLFGTQQYLTPPFSLEAGKSIMINATEADKVTLSKFAPGEPDQKRVVSTKVDEVIRAIVDLGGVYPDVVQALQEAKAKGALHGRFEVDALPSAGRRYYREDGDAEGVDHSAEADDNGFIVANPQPGLFDSRVGKKPPASTEGSANASDGASVEKSDGARSADGASASDSAGGDEGAGEAAAADDKKDSPRKGFFGRLRGGK